MLFFVTLTMTQLLNHQLEAMKAMKITIENNKGHEGQKVKCLRKCVLSEGH